MFGNPTDSNDDFGDSTFHESSASKVDRLREWSKLSKTLANLETSQKENEIAAKQWDAFVKNQDKRIGLMVMSPSYLEELVVNGGEKIDATAIWSRSVVPVALFGAALYAIIRTPKGVAITVLGGLKLFGSGLSFTGAMTNLMVNWMGGATAAGHWNQAGYTSLFTPIGISRFVTGLSVGLSSENALSSAKQMAARESVLEHLMSPPASVPEAAIWHIEFWSDASDIEIGPESGAP